MVLINLDDDQLQEAVEPSLTETQCGSLYLKTCWPNGDEGLLSVLTSPKNGNSRQRWFPLSESQTLVEYVLKQSADADTRVSWCSFTWRKREASRAAELPGLFVDIDLRGGHHTQDNLSTMDEAQSCLQDMPPVSLLLDTGGGLLAVWLFGRPYSMADDRQRAERLLRQWEDDLRRRLGKSIDKAAKLTAVPRIPGTLNHKSQTLVRFLAPEVNVQSYGEGLKLMRTVPRYSIEQLEGFIGDRAESLSSDDDFEERQYSQQDKDDAFATVAKLSAEQADDRELWVKAGLCLKEIGSSFEDSEDCFQRWIAFSRQSERFSETSDDAYRKEWDSFAVDNRGNAVAILINMVREATGEPSEFTITGVTPQSVPADPEDDYQTLLREDHWPSPLSDTALIGPAGDFIRAIEPFTEADPAALLFQLLLTFGNQIGRDVWFKAEADRHCGNLFGVMMGQSAKGRKGTSYGQVMRICDMMLQQDQSDFDESLEYWRKHCHADGLSTGVGLIWAVRDEVTIWDNKNQEQRIVDPGVSDKRLMVSEGEFAQILKVMKREGNDLSPVLRKAWDAGDLRSVVKNAPAKATGAHISIVGHITATELQSHLTETEIANGFGNRFLWVCVRRSKTLATSPQADEQQLQSVADSIRQAVESATFGEIGRSAAAEDIWRQIYPKLSRERYGVAGSLLSRAEAQVMRLAMLFALLDMSREIDARHLQAALECWRYAEDSVRFVFGDRTGHPLADAIRDALKDIPRGMTRTELSAFFGRHKSKAELDTGLRILLESDLIEERREAKSAGRPAVRYCLQNAK